MLEESIKQRIENLRLVLRERTSAAIAVSTTQEPLAIEDLEDVTEEGGCLLIEKQVDRYVSSEALKSAAETLLENDGKKGSYELIIEPDKIQVSANSSTGLYYGVQTIRQLLPPQIENQEKVAGISWVVPCLKIKDEPRFSYRGLHLDVGRHFFPASFIN